MSIEEIPYCQDKKKRTKAERSVLSYADAFLYTRFIPPLEYILLQFTLLHFSHQILRTNSCE